MNTPRLTPVASVAAVTDTSGSTSTQTIPTLADLRPAASASTTWPRVVLVSTIVGALLFLAGQAALPVLPDTIEQAFPDMVAKRDQLMAARLLTGAGCFLLVITAIGFGTLLARRTSSRTVRVGAVFVAVGMFFNAVAQAVSGYATYAATASGVPTGAGREIVAKVGTGAVGFPLSFASVPLFALGFLVLAVGLAISRSVPLWLPALLLVGTVMAGMLAGRGPIVALTQAPVTVALIVLAVVMTRTGGRRQDRG